VDNPAAACDKIRTLLYDYVQAYKLKALIIGESGGVDSAVVTALAYPVCKNLGIRLVGRSIPIESNKEDERKRAYDISHAFCTSFKTTGQIEDVYNFYTKYKFRITDPIRRGNIKARMRMIYLYDLAYQEQGLVLSTDNFTEYLLGFWTLHGDVGDLGMVQELWKSEVYDIALWMCQEYFKEKEFDKADALKACIDAKPTDGLGISDNDLDQIYPKWKEECTDYRGGYSIVDNILNFYITQSSTKWDTHPVVQRYKATMFKRSNPYNFKRAEIIN